MTAYIYVTNVSDYDTFMEATRNAGFVVSPQDWHYTKYGVKVAFESADHASAFLDAVCGLRIGDSKVMARKSGKTGEIVQSCPRIKWPIPATHDIQRAFCDTYAATTNRAEELQPRLLLNEILDGKRKICFGDGSDTDPGEDMMDEASQASKTESDERVKLEDVDEAKFEDQHAVKDEDSDPTKDEIAARINILANLPVRVGLTHSS